MFVKKKELIELKNYLKINLNYFVEEEIIKKKKEKSLH